ncbi:hypothetical protein TBLA_0A04260 [Henningerozyma blattae CBS 6284]|uniref:Major facilitator superfamily (MFS) profile domain-containing protein n=1 Tax=Henningerozyma blattae (strain ATCC 34711 / CBS 6284 / DSM 70876 / NBRC 10599 / NRRL Y-10934 / UCD 77-7) TaxID=1071380 RepID=I2GVR9_HENB6|nr:hypothetical protein TBLA_0A04260 [Tetrapisispora blattae CBS 6284]CCH58221.1 hypothetical protein TBLA_0A04260 [Tetrapisispora blattae CBS 6284]
MYLDSFKNTFFVDILEYFNVIQIIEYPNDISTSSSSLNKKFSNQDEKKNSILLKDDSSIKDYIPEYHYSPKLSSSQIDIRHSELSSDETVQDTEWILRDPYCVTWHNENDIDNPQNWSIRMKTVMMIQTSILTCVTYMGASIYTPGQEDIQNEFNVGHIVGTLNLSVYVLGYGFGQVFFAPLSEVSTIDRQIIYSLTLLFYSIFQIGCATVNNIGGLIVIRFITGFLSSQALATTGATMADFLDARYYAYLLGLWSVGAIAAPILAPLLGACMVVAKNWRWIFWFLCWLSATITLITMFFYPETNHANILHRRAKRLRKQIGDNKYYTMDEKKMQTLSYKEFAITILYKPFKIMIHEPIIMAFDVYSALVYAVFYIFFEAFPLVFSGIYHFTLIELGLSYMGFAVGTAISYPLFAWFIYKYISPKLDLPRFQPESFLVIILYLCWLFPIALFMFGWTAGVHWSLPMVSEIVFCIFQFTFFQIIFTYLALSYPTHVASVFAGNGVVRSCLAGAFPLFGDILFNNLATPKFPVAWGCSVLGFIALAMCTIPFLIYKFGAYLRSKSSYTD